MMMNSSTYSYDYNYLNDSPEEYFWNDDNETTLAIMSMINSLGSREFESMMQNILFEEKLLFYFLRLLGLFLPLGLIGNILVILSIIFIRFLRTTTNILLLSLNLADVFVILLSFFVEFFKYELSETVIIVLDLVLIYMFFCSMFHLVAISFERYFAVTKPLNNRSRVNRITVLIKVGLIWLVSLIPFLVYFYIEKLTLLLCDHYAEMQYCENIFGVPFINEYSPVMRKTRNISFAVIVVVIPGILMIFCYTRIAWKLFKRQREFQNADNANATMSQQIIQTKRTIKMIICLILSVFLCWLPKVLKDLLNDNPLHLVPDQRGFLYSSDSSIYKYLPLLNSCFNPLIYGIVSVKFREGYMIIFRRIISFVTKPCQRGVRRRPEGVARRRQPESEYFTAINMGDREMNSISDQYFTALDIGESPF